MIVSSKCAWSSMFQLASYLQAPLEIMSSKYSLELSDWQIQALANKKSSPLPLFFVFVLFLSMCFHFVGKQKEKQRLLLWFLCVAGSLSMVPTYKAGWTVRKLTEPLGNTLMRVATMRLADEGSCKGWPKKIINYSKH